MSGESRVMGDDTGLTSEEMAMLKDAGNLHNRFARLPEYGREHKLRVCEAVHVIQDLLLMRPTYRKLRGLTE